MKRVLQILSVIALSLLVQPIESQKLVFRTDLQVLAIHASQCDKSKDTADAFYMANLMVDVANRKAAKVGAAAEIILTVTYFDMKKGKRVTLTRKLPKLNPYPMKPWITRRYVVVMTPILVKKSEGITAAIKAKSPSIEDPFPENDKKTVHECTLMVN